MEVRLTGDRAMIGVRKGFRSEFIVSIYIRYGGAAMILMIMQDSRP